MSSHIGRTAAAIAHVILFVTGVAALTSNGDQAAERRGRTARNRPADAALQASQIAERLRSDLDQKGVIVANEPHTVTEAISYIASQYTAGGLGPGLSACGLTAVRNTPPRADSKSLNVFNVRMVGKNPCSGVREQQSCVALINNCITIGSSVFCDFDYLLRMGLLARATYGYAHLAASNGVRTILAFDPRMYIDFATSQMRIETQSSRVIERSPSELGVHRYANANHSVHLDMVESAVLGFVVGHEVVHVYQNTCPAVLSKVRPNADARLRQAYGLLCDSSTNDREMTADLRGAHWTADWIRTHFALYQIDRMSDKRGMTRDHDAAVAKLWQLKTGLAYVALAKAFEYDLIVGRAPAENLTDVKGEPAAGRGGNLATLYRELMKYYQNVGRRRVNATSTKKTIPGFASHLDTAFRITVMLGETGLGDLSYDERLDVITAAPRLRGFLIGYLQELQNTNCRGRQVPPIASFLVEELLTRPSSKGEIPFADFSKKN